MQKHKTTKKTYNNPGIITSHFTNHSKDSEVREEIKCWLEAKAVLHSYMKQGPFE